MNKLFDLRFVIGAFFTVIGLLLLIYAFISGGGDVKTVNTWCGSIFLIFGIVMVILSLQKDADDELITED